jgi:hypothetical protein
MEVDEALTLSHPRWTPEGFHFCGLLPVRGWRAKFICPSVFKKFVSRNLTEEELRNSWDIASHQA